MPSKSRPHQSGVPGGNRLLALALVVTALAYLATLRFDFVYDDEAQIVLNTAFSSWRVLPSLFLGHSWEFMMPDWVGNYYRPLFMVWLLANRMLFGIDSVAWHASAVFLHLLATAMAYLVARQLFRDGIRAGFVALLFGLHPIHVESVAWVSGATDSLMAVFAFGTFWAWVNGERSPERQSWWQALAAIFYAAACLSKETGFLVPFVVVAYDALFVREERTGHGWGRAALRVWPLWLTGAIYVGVRSFALRGMAHAVSGSVWSELLTVPTILWGYMRRLVWPVNLSIFYDTPPVNSALQWRFWLPALAWIIAGVVAWRVAQRSRIVAISLIWILVFLAPAILGLPVFPPGEWIHDRYLYLPAFGFCVLLVHTAMQFSSKRVLFGVPVLTAASLMVLVTAMAFATIQEEQYWANGYRLFQHSAELQPSSSLNLTHLASEDFRRGKLRESQELYERALQLDPDNWKNNVAYGLMLYYSGQYEKADQQLSRSIAMQGGDSNQYLYQGLSRFQTGHFAGAQQAFQEAIKAGPRVQRYHFWLGFALEKQGKFAEARRQYEEELRQHPQTDTQARERLARLPPA